MKGKQTEEYYQYFFHYEGLISASNINEKSPAPAGDG